MEEGTEMVETPYDKAARQHVQVIQRTPAGLVRVPVAVTVRLANSETGIADTSNQFTTILRMFHEQEPDVRIICRAQDALEDEDSISLAIVETSKMLLASSSRYLAEILSDVSESVQERDDYFTFHLEEFDLSSVESLINLLLTGEVNCNSLEELSKLKSLTKALRLSFSFLLPGESPEELPKPKEPPLMFQVPRHVSHQPVVVAPRGKMIVDPPFQQPVQEPPALSFPIQPMIPEIHGDDVIWKNPPIIQPPQDPIIRVVKPVIRENVKPSKPLPKLSELSEGDKKFYERLQMMRKLPLGSMRTLGMSELGDRPKFRKKKKKLKKKSAEEDKPETVYFCKFCDQQVMGMANLTKHVNEHANQAKAEMGENVKSVRGVKPNPPKPYVLGATRKLFCDKCGESFAHRKVFIAHMRNHRIVNKQESQRGLIYECDFCGMHYPSISSVNAHKKHVHNVQTDHRGRIKLNLNCKFCGKKWVSRKALAEHEATHTMEKNYICETCGFATNSDRNLNQHRQVHKNVKRFQCDECEKSFSLKEAYDSHMNKHKGVFPYVCDLCGKGFTLKNNLHQHNLRVHLDFKRYECTICCFKCKTRPIMKRHMICHTESNVLPYECSLCEERFHNMSTGRRHSIKLHAGHAQIKFESCPELEKLASVAIRNLGPDCDLYHPVKKELSVATKSKVSKKRKRPEMEEEEELVDEEDESFIKSVEEAESEIDDLSEAGELTEVVKIEVHQDTASISIEEYDPQIQVAQTTEIEQSGTHHVIATPAVDAEVIYTEQDSQNH